MSSVADLEPEPEGSEFFGRIRIRSGTETNVSDQDSNSDPKQDPKKICLKELCFQAEIRVSSCIRLCIFHI